MRRDEKRKVANLLSCVVDQDVDPISVSLDVLSDDSFGFSISGDAEIAWDELDFGSFRVGRVEDGISNVLGTEESKDRRSCGKKKSALYPSES